jgi:hypothetical protein
MTAQGLAVPDILLTLMRAGFEARLVEGGGLVIFDAQYKSGRQIRPTPPALSRLVFSNADRVGRWLEKRTPEEVRKALAENR